MACEDNLPKACCCGCSLRCGGITITGLGITSCCLMLIGLSIALSGASSDGIEEPQQQTIAWIEIILIIILTIKLIIYCMALHGILNSNIKLIKPWLTYEALAIVVGLILRVCALASRDEYNQFVSVIGIVLWSVIEFHCWRVMYALYLEIKNAPSVVQTQVQECPENEESFHSSEF